jgi:hypothetical protein
MCMFSINVYTRVEMRTKDLNKPAATVVVVVVVVVMIMRVVSFCRVLIHDIYIYLHSSRFVVSAQLLFVCHY